MKQNFVRSLLITLCVTLACYKMVPMSLEEVATEKPYRVWVTHSDQVAVEINGPQVFNDTLVGYIRGVFAELPAKDISKVTIKRSAKGKTMALVAGSIATAGMIGVLISGIGSDGRDPGVDCMDVPDDPRCQGQGP